MKVDVIQIHKQNADGSFVATVQPKKVEEVVFKTKPGATAWHSRFNREEYNIELKDPDGGMILNLRTCQVDRENEVGWFEYTWQSVLHHSFFDLSEVEYVSGNMGVDVTNMMVDESSPGQSSKPEQTHENVDDAINAAGNVKGPISEKVKNAAGNLWAGNKHSF